MKNKITIIIAGAVILLVGSFYVGTKYGQGNTQSSRNTAAVSSFGQGNGTVGANVGIRVGRGAGGGFVAGQVISKDSNSLTIQIAEGGSKIVFLATSTQVMKATEGNLGDISTGISVVVAGSANSDGSITAQSVQIRPERPQAN